LTAGVRDIAEKNFILFMFQGTKEDYEKCATAAKEAWNIWADVSTAACHYMCVTVISYFIINASIADHNEFC